MVQVPVEIAFHNLEPVPWAEEEIRARIAKLEKIFDRMVTCRVRVDQRATNAARNIPPVVRIEIGVPGREDLVVAHEPERLQKRYQTPDLYNAINEAFRIAEEQLSEYKRALQERGRERPANDPSHQFLGEIVEIDPKGEFGFIRSKEGSLLYFHRNSVLAGDFSALRPGDAVHYVEEMGDTGPLASKVRVKETG